jgi:hypothetical protein
MEIKINKIEAEADSGAQRPINQIDNNKELFSHATYQLCAKYIAGNIGWLFLFYSDTDHT